MARHQQMKQLSSKPSGWPHEPADQDWRFLHAFTALLQAQCARERASGLPFHPVSLRLFQLIDKNVSVANSTVINAAQQRNQQAEEDNNMFPKANREFQKCATTNFSHDLTAKDKYIVIEQPVN